MTDNINLYNVCCRERNKGNNYYTHSETVTDRNLFSCAQHLISDPSENRTSTGFVKFHYIKPDVKSDVPEGMFPDCMRHLS